MSDKSVAIIDGDMLVFRVLIGLECEIDWGDGIWTLHANEHEGWERIIHRLNAIAEKLDVASVVMCFSGANNFRKRLWPAYKGNREHVRKPLCYRSMVERLLTCPGIGGLPLKRLRYDGIEADDLMGIIATKPGNEGRTIIVSEDKDMRSIPGKLWCEGNSEQREIIEITKEEADYFHLYQTLTGDQADNYPGCPGVGPKTAERLLRDARGDRWQAVVMAYKKAGLTEEDALVQARVARILRWTDFDHTTKQPILWRP